ncbi:MAG TPA: AAA family ATPase, partial [Thermoprotei archaeon]|nr:AAA family ATPase [Thermoprotei archaeon]
MSKIKLDDIFDSILHSRIFLNREYLMPDYVPDELPHRDKQIIKLGSILAPALANSRPQNVFIYGLTGTGKTAVTRYVLRKMLEKDNRKIIFSYINCRMVDTNYRVLADLVKSLGKHVPFTGLSTAEVLNRFTEYLDRKSKIMIVVLDEIDYLVKKSGDNILYHLTRLNSILKNSKLSLIGITNDLNFISYLDSRVKSSLCEKELVFPPYTTQELEDILMQRAEKALRKDAIGDGVISLCAAIAAKQNGDCRLALDLLLKSAEIAEEEGLSKITEDIVRRAQKEIERDLVIDLVRSMPFHLKMVLLSIYFLKKQGNRRITTGEVYDFYKKLGGRLGIDIVTHRRVSDIISELDTLGIINSKIVSLGRYGRTKIINFSASEK